MSLTLYHFNGCPYCRKVMDTIEELNIKDKITFKDILENDEYRNELVKLTGKKQVPCLFVDEKPMHESNEIIDYLQQKF